MWTPDHSAALAVPKFHSCKSPIFCIKEFSALQKMKIFASAEHSKTATGFEGSEKSNCDDKIEATTKKKKTITKLILHVDLQRLFS